MSDIKDKYDLAIEYLTESPGEIQSAWISPLCHEAGSLFCFVTPTGSNMSVMSACGCLTTIKGKGHTAFTQKLTDAIRADDRIPADEDEITVEHLPIFAEWQRRIDKELGRV